MRRKYPPHFHKCSNSDRGCGESFPCSAAPEDNGDGTLNCPYDNDLFHCEECIDADYCEDCGAFPHLMEPHFDFCDQSVLNRDDSPEAKALVEGNIQDSEAAA